MAQGYTPLDPCYLTSNAFSEGETMQALYCAIFLNLFLFSTSWAQTSTCYNYDIKNQTPSETRVDLIVKCMVKGDTLYLDGGIDAWVIDELHIYALEPIKHISLNSKGGAVKDAVEIATFIREHKITTHVRKDAVCKSACTLIYQAGVIRTAHPSATFMYHSARYLFQSKEKQKQAYSCSKSKSKNCIEYESKKQSLQNTTDILFGLYEDYGISFEFYRLYKSMPTDPLWYESGNYLQTIDWELTAEEALSYNIVQVLLN